MLLFKRQKQIIAKRKAVNEASRVACLKSSVRCRDCGFTVSHRHLPWFPRETKAEDFEYHDEQYTMIVAAFVRKANRE